MNCMHSIGSANEWDELKWIYHLEIYSLGFEFGE